METPFSVPWSTCSVPSFTCSVPFPWSTRQPDRKGENQSVLRGRLTYHFAATSRRQHPTRIFVSFVDRSAALTRIISSDISRVALRADLQCAGSYETYGALAAFLASGQLHFGSFFCRGGRTGGVIMKMKCLPVAAFMLMAWT